MQTISYSTQLVPQINYQQSINETEKSNYVLHFTTPILNSDTNSEQPCGDVNNELNSAKSSDSQRVINTVQENIMTKKQIILLKQQLTQHVQLMTQAYMLCPKAKKFQLFRRKLKNFLVNSILVLVI